VSHLQLKTRVAFQSTSGIKPVNEDAVCCFIPADTHQLNTKGVAVALADGVSSAEAGKEASETATKQFINDYYKTPDTWTVNHAGQKILTTINLNLFKKSHQFIQEEKGFLCTFSALILKSRTLHYFHAGDSRIYKVSKNALHQVTRDHTVSIAKGHNILSRAVGMDSSLQIDYGKQEVQEGDVFLLTSDGVHDFLDSDAILDCIQKHNVEQEAVDALIQASLDAGSDDNISCALLYVDHLPKENIDDLSSKLTRLPFPPELSVGMEIDGYRVQKEIFASARSQVYMVRDIKSGKEMIMKTPSVNFEDDIHYIDRFIQEEWIGKRVDSDHVVKIIEQNRPRKYLYYLMEFVSGITLDRWIRENQFPKPKRAIKIVEQIAQGLSAFHEKETIHQDLKPANIIINDKDEIKIIDFGSTFVAGIAEMYSAIEHEGVLGTATYSDPQYLMGKNTGIQGDLYALATITYEIFTGELPYGDKIESCQTPMDYDRLRYQNAYKHNPIIPDWFDSTLKFGTHFDLEKRYQSIGAFLTDLKHPNPIYLLDEYRGKPDKSPVFFWQMLSAFWFFMFLISLMMFATN
jgi:serine/threonine protein phosphatase PrpC